MEFTVECTISGVSWILQNHTLKQAIDFAKENLRNPMWRNAIYHNGIKIAEIGTNFEWISPSFLNPQTGGN